LHSDRLAAQAAIPRTLVTDMWTPPKGRMKLALVSATESPLAEALSARLIEGGHSPRRLSLDSWLQTQHEQSEPAVIAFDSGTLSGARRAVRLIAPRCRSCLGVFAHLDPASDRDLLLSIREFVSWPCSAEELRLRLERICPPMPRPVATHQA